MAAEHFFDAKARAERYRQSVSEEAFETWMNSGGDFAKVIAKRMDTAEGRRDHSSVRFWQDVLVSAHDFDSYPENRRKRDEMTFYGTDVPEAAA